MLLWCSICHELMKEDGHISATKCGHLFHHPCLEPWVHSSQSCPQCREPLSTGGMFRVFPPAEAGVGGSAAGGNAATTLASIQQIMFELDDGNVTKRHMLDQMLENCESLRSSLAFHDSQAHNKDKQIKKLIEENETQKISIETMNRELTTVRTDSSNRLENVTKLENLVQEYQDNINSYIEIQNLLRDNVQALDGELNTTRMELIRAQQTAADLEQQVEDSNQNVSNLEQRIQNLNSTITNHEQKIANLNDKVIDLEQQYEESNRKVMHLEQQFEGSNDKVIYLEELLEDLNHKLIGLEQQLEGSNHKVIDLEQQLADSNHKIIDLEQRLEDSNHEERDLERQLDDSNRKLIDLEQQIKDGNHKLANLQQQLEDSNHKIALLRRQIPESNEKTYNLENFNDFYKKICELELEDSNTKDEHLETQISYPNQKAAKDKRQTEALPNGFHDLESNMEYSYKKVYDVQNDDTMHSSKDLQVENIYTEVPDQIKQAKETKAIVGDLELQLDFVDATVGQQQSNGFNTMISNLELFLQNIDSKVADPGLEFKISDNIVEHLDHVETKPDPIHKFDSANAKDDEVNHQNQGLNVKETNNKLMITKKKTVGQIKKFRMLNTLRTHNKKMLKLVIKSKTQLRKLLNVNEIPRAIKRMLETSDKKFRAQNRNLLVKKKNILNGKVWRWAVSVVEFTNNHFERLNHQNMRDQNVQVVALKKYNNALKKKILTMECELTRKRITMLEQAKFLTTLEDKIRQCGTMVQQFRPRLD